MATRDERSVLEIVDEEGGEASEVKIAKCMGLRLDYVRTILGSMGRRDFIDVLASGKIKLAEKGWKALGKTPHLPYGMMPSGPPESPEERYKRWLEGKAPQKPKEEKAPKKKDTTTILRETSLENLSPRERLKKWTGQ